MRRSHSSLRHGSRVALALLLFASAGSLDAQGTGCDASSRSPSVHEANGVQTIGSRSDGMKVELQLLRLAPTRWSTRLVDMRQLRQMNATRGSYTSPTYTLTELAQLTDADILASAGMTDSLNAPVPVGLLKTDGVVRNKGNAASRILDGILCVPAQGSVRLLSEVTPAGRRIPQNWKSVTESCRQAVQAGPMLVDKAQPLIASRGRLSISRVFAAVDRQGRLVIGYSPSATTFDLACALSAPSLDIEQAIALQGDELGGVLIGTKAQRSPGTWGEDSATLASALVLKRRR
jgi:hypothetical protein